MEGYNGTIAAYGQTGSGKTYTMTGPDAAETQLEGLVPRAVHQVRLLCECLPNGCAEAELFEHCRSSRLWRQMQAWRTGACACPTWRCTTRPSTTCCPRQLSGRSCAWRRPSA